MGKRKNFGGFEVYGAFCGEIFDIPVVSFGAYVSVLSVAVAVRIEDHLRSPVRMSFPSDLFRIRAWVFEKISSADGVFFDCKTAVALSAVVSRRLGSGAVKYG